MLDDLFETIRRRLPAKRDTLYILGVVLFAVFGWSIRGFLYKLPSFTMYFGLTSNLAILSYMFGFALVESLIVTGFLLLVGALLPGNVFRQGFAYKGFIVIFVMTIASIAFEGWYRIEFFKDIMAANYYPIPPFLIGTTVSVASVVVLLRVFHIRPSLQHYILIVMEQLSIFTYVYIPLGLIGLVVVLIRNLL